MPVTFNKEMASLTAPMVSNNTEEESNGREAAKQKWQSLKLGFRNLT